MLKFALAQINTTVGDFSGNTKKILALCSRAAKAQADAVIFPELAVCGYPPEDLLLKGHFIEANLKALNALAKKIHGIHAIVGFVDSDASGKIYNAAALIADGAIKDIYHKRQLPNYGVFDEKRYFTAGHTSNGVWTIQGTKVAVNICEDIWVDSSIYAEQAKAAPKVIINMSCSPFEVKKLAVRQDLLANRAKECKAPFIYVNCVGGQDELIFDGASMVVSPDGTLVARAKQFEEDLLVVSLGQASHPAPLLEENEEIYKALVLGIRDYVGKNGFRKVALGLSGGIDSALVAVLAVDALGKENVVGVSMPSPYNLKATRQDAAKVAANLGIEFLQIPIKRIFAQYLHALAPWFSSTPPNTAEENLQARVRGNLMMAFSNKFGWLVLTTGNKSEMAVGYCTLYGDMSGGFAPLKDIFKTRVYALARWRNSCGQEPVIPKSILLRAPSAELRPNQTDEESLGAYEELDYVLEHYIEGRMSAATISSSSKLPLKYVQKTAKLVDINEYKRRQGPPGIKISSLAFGKDWRLPITNEFNE